MSKQSKTLDLTNQLTWSTSQKKQFQDDLLYWYDDRKRDLPWRLNQNPYRIWVSEIMLQQTQVVTVIPYFERFMDWFPTIQALAEAPEDKLLKAWEGLGYYSRVRNMQVAAIQMVTEHEGKMPNQVEAISQLKGIGPYTAGAISSIAFDLPEPAIDGNVMRVYSRLFEVPDDIAKASSRKVFDHLVRQTISHEDPSGFNQGLMDLGATVCKPTSPDCSICPLKAHCLSYKKGSAAHFPVKSKKVKAKPVFYFAQIIQNELGEYLMEQRPATGLLANLWQFPLLEGTKVPAKGDGYDFDLLTQSPFSPAVNWSTDAIGEITHIFTHLKWTVAMVSGELLPNQSIPLAANQRWVSIEQMNELPMPKPQLKMLEKLSEK